MTLPDRKSTRLNSSHLGISYAVRRPLPPFPTRRSSDLIEQFQGVRAVVDRQPPHAVEEAGHAFDAAHAPGFHLLERAHEHLVKAQAVGAVFLDDLVGIDDVARSEEHTSELQSLRHLVCRPPPTPPFPYTTLFRSNRAVSGRSRGRRSPAATRG